MFTLRRHKDGFHWWLKIARNQWSFLMQWNHNKVWTATTDIVTTREMLREAS